MMDRNSMVSDCGALPTKLLSSLQSSYAYVPKELLNGSSCFRAESTRMAIVAGSSPIRT
jgi:hypothetical protein